jgi:succinyl-CoA synthetase alpha subunit
MSTEASMHEALEPLFNPRSIAVIGATNSWNKWGFSTFASILNGFGGKVYPVNNQEPEVLGHKAYRRVTDIPEDEPVDLAVFVIPPPGVRVTMEDCIQKGVKAGVVITAGFAETGPEGKRLQDELLDIARQGPLRFIGPNCMGYWSASCNLRAFMFPLPVQEGPLAFVSQGGNVGGAVLRMGYERGLGFHRYISCGCTADIQMEDYIEHFGQDPKVKIILAYIEGLGDGQRFLEKVRRITPHKPVIVLKPGRTEAGTKAITSHSGALAGSSDLYDSVFKKAGVIRVNTADSLLDVAIGLLTQPLPQGRNLAIITPGGSYGVISADACAALGLNVIPLSDDTISQFDRIFPPRWSRGNPVDPAGDRNFIAYMQAPEMLLKLPEVDAMIFMGFDSFANFSSVFATISSKLADSLIALMKELSDLVPDGLLDDQGSDKQWMNKLIGRVVGVFFSFFGTSDPEEVKAFGRRQAELMANDTIAATLGERLATVFQEFKAGQVENIGEMFGQIFQPLLDALLLNWIEAYRKPVITTSFMGQVPSVSPMGRYAYPFAEQAAFVLSKLVEYSEFLQREGIDPKDR